MKNDDVKTIAHCLQEIAQVLLASCGQSSDRRLEVSGWLNDGWQDEGIAVVKRVKVFTEVNPYWYNLGTSDGPPGNSDYTDLDIFAREWVIDPVLVRMLSHTENKLVVPTIGDNAPPTPYFQTEDARRETIAKIVELVLVNDYGGIDLNFEHIVPGSEQMFATFVHQLASALEARNRILSVTLRACSNPRYEQMLGVSYRLLSATNVHRFKLMLYDNLYDQANYYSSPTPVAPMEWVKKCTEYVLACGIDRAKLQLAFHNYGYMWEHVAGNWMLKPGFRSHEDIMRLAPETDDTVDSTFDHVSKEEFITFSNDGRAYAAYFGGPKAIEHRVKYARSMKVRGVTFWVLGREHPQAYSCFDSAVIE